MKRVNSVRPLTILLAAIAVMAFGVTLAQDNAKPPTTTPPAETGTNGQKSEGTTAEGTASANQRVPKPPVPKDESGKANGGNSGKPQGGLSADGSCTYAFASSTWFIPLFWSMLIGIIALTAALLVYTTRNKPVAIVTLTTSFFFWLGTGYLALLLVLGAFYALMVGKCSPFMLGGVLPVAVPWFGALGAVTISLAGVFAYSDQDWDKRFNYWHIGRPLFGAVVGVVAYFMFILILGSSGASIPILEPDVKTTPKDYIIYYVLAFLVGYREETFRELIQRVTDLILKPNSPDEGAPQLMFKTNGVAITELDFGKAVIGTPVTKSIQVENSGSKPLTAPSALIDAGPNSPFTIANNSLTAMKELKPGSAATLDVEFNPAAAGTFTGALSVSGNNLGSKAALKLKGSA